MITKLLEALSPLSPVCPEGIPAPELPCITVTQVGDQLLHRADGRDYARRYAFQVDAYACTKEESWLLFFEASQLIARGSFPFALEDCYGNYDDQNLTYRAGGRFTADAIIKEE